MPACRGLQRAADHAHVLASTPALVLLSCRLCDCFVRMQLLTLSESRDPPPQDLQVLLTLPLVADGEVVCSLQHRHMWQQAHTSVLALLHQAQSWVSRAHFLCLRIRGTQALHLDFCHHACVFMLSRCCTRLHKR